MRPYEGMFLLDSSGANGAIDESITALEGAITKHGGEIVLSRKWGERRLIYEINRHKKAHYQLLFFKFDPQKIVTLRRELDLSENVIRHLFLAHRDDRWNELLELAKNQIERKVIEEPPAPALGEPRRLPPDESEREQEVIAKGEEE